MGTIPVIFYLLPALVLSIRARHTDISTIVRTVNFFWNAAQRLGRSRYKMPRQHDLFLSSLRSSFLTIKKPAVINWPCTHISYGWHFQKCPYGSRSSISFRATFKRFTITQSYAVKTPFCFDGSICDV